MSESHTTEKKAARRFVDNDFLQRYTKTIVVSQVIGLIFILGPFYIYSLENYSIFVKFADQMSPRLVGNLLRERYHLNLGFVTAILAFVVFWTVLSQKWIKRVSGPIYLIQQHLHWLARGNYNKKPLLVRKDDEFIEVVSALNVLHSVVRQNVVNDLEKIETMLSANQSPLTVEILEKMKKDKLDMMGYGINEGPDSQTTFDGRKLVESSTLPIRNNSLAG